MRTRVASSDWWASRKVVSVTATASCWRSEAANFSGPTRMQQVAGPRLRWRVQVDRGQLAARAERGPLRAVRLVDGHLGEVGEQLGAAVGRRPGGQQLGPLVDERRRQAPGHEVGLVQQGLQERDVGGDAADPELGQRAARAAYGGREVGTAAGELDEHGVEVRADLGADEDGAAVQADAGAAGGAVDRDPAGVRAEAVGGVLGGDPALQRRAAQPYGVLGQAELGQGGAGRDPQLGAAPGRRR